jgi:hypothetical protein
MGALCLVAWCVVIHTGQRNLRKIQGYFLYQTLTPSIFPVLRSTAVVNSSCVVYKGKGKGKGKFHPIKGHEGPEVE